MEEKRKTRYILAALMILLSVFMVYYVKLYREFVWMQDYRPPIPAIYDGDFVYAQEDGFFLTYHHDEESGWSVSMERPYSGSYGAAYDRVAAAYWGHDTSYTQGILRAVVYGMPAGTLLLELIVVLSGWVIWRIARYLCAYARDRDVG